MQNRFFTAPTIENADALVQYIRHENPDERVSRLHSFINEFKSLRNKKREHYFYVMYILYLTNTVISGSLSTLKIYTSELATDTYLEYASAVLHTPTASSDEWNAVLISFAAFTNAAKLSEALTEVRRQGDHVEEARRITAIRALVTSFAAKTLSQLENADQSMDVKDSFMTAFERLLLYAQTHPLEFTFTNDVFDRFYALAQTPGYEKCAWIVVRLCVHMQPTLERYQNVDRIYPDGLAEYQVEFARNFFRLDANAFMESRFFRRFRSNLRCLTMVTGRLDSIAVLPTEVILDGVYGLLRSSSVYSDEIDNILRALLADARCHDAFVHNVPIITSLSKMFMGPEVLERNTAMLHLFIPMAKTILA